MSGETALTRPAPASAPARLALAVLSHPAVRFLALAGLCAAYLQGGLTKALDWPGALAEMRHFGLEPAPLFALATILVELGAALAILAGWRRWIGALTLAAFTLAATFLANRFWEMEGPARFAATNAFFEHLGLVGAFLLVAWLDLDRAGGRRP
jgi:uncharacterized membrane protein YphA (DoxX/SURF4 family)